MMTNENSRKWHDCYHNPEDVPDTLRDVVVAYVYAERMDTVHYDIGCYGQYHRWQTNSISFGVLVVGWMDIEDCPWRSE